MSFWKQEYQVGVTVRVGKWGRNNTLVSEDRPGASDVDNMRAHTQVVKNSDQQLTTTTTTRFSLDRTVYTQQSL